MYNKHMEEKKKKLTEEELQKIEKERTEEMEREAILLKADEIKEETFNFNLDGQVELKNEMADLVLEEIDNPEEKYQLYYKVINRLLMKHLPKGDAYKDARELIYEEKNTFLTGKRKDERGIRHADGRMSYIPNMNELVNIITEWITVHGTPYDLYIRLRDLNVEKGYGAPTTK